MSIVIEPERLQIVAMDPDSHLAQFALDVEMGLTGSPKRLPCRYFYDVEGSRLFEEICRLPEYYLTRTERQILQERAAEIAALMPEGTALVELGSGSAAKTRLLIEAFLERQGRLSYLPIDISPSILEESSLALMAEYSRLEITAIAATYEDGLTRLRAEANRPRLILWLGSNVGNLDREEAAGFLRLVRQTMSSPDRLLMGIDLRKDRETLERAYDDARGVTAQFNMNLLVRINEELGGQFDLGSFRHRAVYDEEKGRVEMHLVSARAQRVPIERLRTEVSFALGESIHTENSYKYSLKEIAALGESAGLQIERQWLDNMSRFSVNLLSTVE